MILCELSTLTKGHSAACLHAIYYISAATTNNSFHKGCKRVISDSSTYRAKNSFHGAQGREACVAFVSRVNFSVRARHFFFLFQNWFDIETIEGRFNAIKLYYTDRFNMAASAMSRMQCAQIAWRRFVLGLVERPTAKTSLTPIGSHGRSNACFFSRWYIYVYIQEYMNVCLYQWSPKRQSEVFEKRVYDVLP